MKQLASPFPLLLLCACATPAAVSSEGAAAPAPPPAAASPATATPGGREISLDLVAQYGDNAIGQDKVHLRSYNGALVGPTIRARAGDTLNIHLINRLPPNPPTPNNLEVMAAEQARELTRGVPTPLTNNIPHDFNTTNLHTHGLHVSPSGNGDNVLIAIGPGEDFRYEIKIPTDHPPGTFWYHPHVHGSTAMQVGSGMEGALIIEGDVDRVPEIAAAREEVMLLQQIAYAKRDNPVIREDRKGTMESFNRPFINGEWANGNGRTLINGTLDPVFQMQPGEVQRWRLIDAGVEEAIRVKLAGADGKAVPLNVIALDGITTGRIEPVETIDLYPGYRADVLVRAPEQEGEYVLYDDEQPAQVSLLGQKEPRKAMARIKVSGAKKQMALPSAAALAPLAPYKDIQDSEVTGQQKVHFGVGAGSAYPFAVNGKGFDPANPVRKLKLGGVDEWSISSEVIGPHIFHIHINPFQVIDSNGRKYWKDTLYIPTGATMKMRTRYERYVGKYVLHCHILPHEDLGMMEEVEVVPKTEAHPHLGH